MASSRFRASYKGIGQMLNTPWMEAAMRERAEKVRARAAATAPVETGRYKASLRVESGMHGGDHHDRAFARVVADVPYGLIVEYGTSKQAAHHTLAHALDAVNE